MKAILEIVELKNDIVTTSEVPCGEQDNGGTEVCDLD